MGKDFSTNQGGIQSSDSTQFAPHEGATPVTGFVEAPMSDEDSHFETGPGIGNTRGPGIR